jgi:DNA invertase Pin-like site-specific DNA recombinase
VKREGHKASLRCAIYTRVSTENGLEQEFNSLDNQREASEAYIRSQAHEGWKLIRNRYDDGGFSGGSMDRPALAKLLDDVRARRIDVIVVYKVDRLTRSLADFAKLVELFDEHDVSFISVTQAFNTTTSMGPPDPEYAAFVCPIRARDHGRAHPGQSRCLQKEGHLDGRDGSVRISSGKSRASHR